MGPASQFAAGLLARTKLCRVETSTDSLGKITGITKRRLRRSASLLWLSEQIPALSPHVRGLKLQEWIAWEQQLWREAYGCDITILEDGVMLPALAGVPLGVWLEKRGTTDSVKIKAIAAAFTALRNLHRLSVRWPDGTSHSFSHSDAHVANVMYDVGANEARWFDFETIHDAQAGSAWRHADDLRALLYSSARWLTEQAWETLAATVGKNTPEGEIREALRSQAIQMRSAPHLLHLSQAPMPLEHHCRFSDILIATLQ